MAITQPLDFYEIFVSVAGNMQIFFFLSIVVFAYLSARLRMPSVMFLMLMGLFVIMMANFYPVLYTLLILIGGIFTYSIINKLIKD